MPWAQIIRRERDVARELLTYRFREPNGVTFGLSMQAQAAWPCERPMSFSDFRYYHGLSDFGR